MSFYRPEQKWYGDSLVFDPAEGETVIAPPSEGEGYWAGAPSVLYDVETSRFYLSYRLRKPRPVRGGECYVAESTDGVNFSTIWSSTKEAFDSASVERFSLTKALDGRWLLYPSYVDPADNRWRIDVIEAASPSEFDVAKRRKVFTADDVGVEGVKDPWVMIVNGMYYMLISYAMRLDVDESQTERMHATGDIYNTGLTLSSSALAVSGDGLQYEWLGDIFAPRQSGWDGYAARLGCLVPTASGWMGYYDGSASVEGNYEERTGLVHSWDLHRFYRLTPDGPRLVSPHGSGSLRYIDAVVFDDEVWFYYEYARADGSHELRLNRVKR
ncbi:MAG TPA: hypothetical protein GX702_08935 [Chloroflexi bacterium]|nr:hypothetical protein [Chloroflexota bacterium]